MINSTHIDAGNLDAGSDAVEANLADADKAQGMPHTGHKAVTLAPGETPHVDPSVFGMTGTVWVSVAMTVFLLILLAKKVPALITGALDRQIADIRKQLADAKALRAEAEALRNEYTKKIAEAESSAAAMLAHAELEAKGLVEQARTDANDLVTRRQKMAEDKIAAAERGAIAEIRAKTAAAATKAAASLIAARHGADSDKAIVDSTISGLGRPN